MNYEKPEQCRCPPETLKKPAVPPGMAVTDLTDGCSLFLYLGRGRGIREMRETLGLTAAAYAGHLNIRPERLGKRENDETRVFRESRERCFRQGKKNI